MYGSAARGYKMPALDDLVEVTSQQRIDLFEAREVQAAELGVKYAAGGVGLTVNGFYTTRQEHHWPGCGDWPRRRHDMGYHGRVRILERLVPRSRPS